MGYPLKIRRMALFTPLFAMAVCLLTMQPVRAATYTITVNELATLFDPQRPRNGDLFDQYVVKLLQQELDAQGVRFQAGQLFYSAPFLAVDTLDCGTFSYSIGGGWVDVTLDQNSQFTLALDQLRSATLNAAVTGRAITLNSARTGNHVSAALRQGVRARGVCLARNTNHGRVKVESGFSANLSLAVKLNPHYDPALKALVVNKSASLSGTADLFKKNYSLDFPGLSLVNLVGRFPFAEALFLSLGEAEAKKSFQQELTKINQKFAPFNNVPTVVKLPAGIDMIRLADQIVKEFDLPEVLVDYVKLHPDEVLLALLASDKTKRAEMLAELGSNLSCAALQRRYDRPLPLMTAYQLNGASCVAANQEGPDTGRYFADAQCVVPLAFRPTTTAEFCANRISGASKGILGNAASWTPDLSQVNDPLPSVPSRKWTALPTTRMDVGAISNQGHLQPVTKLLKYKTITGVARGTGTCELEMRVFTANTKLTGLKPVLAIHGGTWKTRGFSVTGLEATVNQFTDRGFVVFAPFYRLTGQSDGNVECNGASWREVVEDVTDALAWVKQHGAAFGAQAGRISVFGQSAGAHLAGYLSTHRPLDVEKAYLLYPPLDMLEFLQGVNPVNNRYAAHEAFGLQSLASLFGAQGGLAEVNFRQVNLTGIDFKRPPATIVDRIPASVFNLASVNATAPPAYLRRCATATNVSLVGMSLTSPPAAIMQCLKRELSDFILENAFTHLVGPNTPPLYVVMGTGDELIPYQNTVAFCEALNAAPLAINPNAIASEFACGTHGKLALLKGANHMLDLGLCVGPICPSGKLGSPLRSAVATTLTSAHAWMKLPDPSNRTGTGGGLAPRVLWSQNFDTNAAGLSPLPAGSMRVANGRLEVSTQNSATEDWPFVWGTREYKLSDRVSFRAEVTTGPQAAGRYVMVGSEGDWNIPVYRRHAVYFDNDTVSASYYDAAFQRVPLGNVLNNMTYVVEVVARPTGTTVYVYEKGKSRASGYSDTRSYSDWGVMGLFIESRSYPGATPVATYVDNLSESVGVP